jgi:hypothetical protein
LPLHLNVLAQPPMKTGIQLPWRLVPPYGVTLQVRCIVPAVNPFPVQGIVALAGHFEPKLIAAARARCPITIPANSDTAVHARYHIIDELGCRIVGSPNQEVWDLFQTQRTGTIGEEVSKCRASRKKLINLARHSKSHRPLGRVAALAESGIRSRQACQCASGRVGRRGASSAAQPVARSQPASTQVQTGVLMRSALSAPIAILYLGALT